MNIVLGQPHLIFVWYCSTHNVKSLRNQLLNSTGKEKAARIFHDVDNVPFGWKGVTSQWDRAVKCMEKNNLH